MVSRRGHPRLGLRGRRSECERLDRLLDRVRAGESQVLVVRGEAGIGKTALLDHLRERAAGFRVASATGVESETELAFSGLHQLCAPALDHLDRLPAPQADALATAFGLGPGRPPDRFLVGLAVLSLLAGLAQEQPLLCVVDDAQWLDRVSAQTLAFVARRLKAGPVALVLAVRDADGEDAFAGLPTLELRGLGDGDALALLESAIPGPVDRRVLACMVAETRGNPLALMELPRGLTPAELAGGFGLPDTVPIAGRIEQDFLRRLEPLPADARRLLLVAATEPAADAATLWSAAGRLGIAPHVAVAAVETGLIKIGATIRFRHPLVRSAVYRAAAAADRREVHGALAEAIDEQLDPERRAWHRAHAAAGPDEAVASELERCAGRVQARGGLAAAAAFLEQATALTPEPERRGARALAAAQAKVDAGAPEAATELLATARLCPLDPLQRARLDLLSARLAFCRARGGETPRALLAAAKRLAPLDAELARGTYLEALGAATFAGCLGGSVLREVAAGARAAPAPPAAPRASDLLLDGLAIRVTDGYPAAVEPLRRAVRAMAREPGRGAERWLWLAWPAALEIWDDESWHEMAARAVGSAREAGALTVLATALVYGAGVHVHTGRFATAAALAEEADEINEATGGSLLIFTALYLAAWQGHERRTLALIEQIVADATARGEGRTVSLAEYARVILHMGQGRYHEAFAAARRACAYEDLGLLPWALHELVEAAARAGDRAAAEAALGRLEVRTRAAGTDWARGIEARSRALLSDGDAAEALYREALERLSNRRLDLQHARVQLIFGEWLRRQGRRADAREPLGAAHEFFVRIGATGFAGRAGRELLATGQRLLKRTPETRDRLTAQEAQIARLAGDGHTNPEIGAQLFLSPRTVEWHLGKVFAKLGIASRRELPAALPLRAVP